MEQLYGQVIIPITEGLNGQQATISTIKGFSKQVTLTYPKTVISLPGMDEYTITQGSSNNVKFTLDCGQYVKTEEFTDIPESLNDASWSLIQELIQNGKFREYYSVGDTKSFVINNKTYHTEVVAINDGTGSAGTWYPNKTVDFISTELYESTYQYNSGTKNSGGFPASNLRNTLVNTLYPLLPSDLKDVIVEKSHRYNVSNTTTLDSTKLWLPTQYEISGATATYAPGETSSNNKKYTLASLIKTRNGQTSSENWWLGSYSSYNSSCFWNVVNSGGLNAIAVANTARGVPLCFRIG